MFAARKTVLKGIRDIESHRFVAEESECPTDIAYRGKIVHQTVNFSRNAVELQKRSKKKTS